MGHGAKQVHYYVMGGQPPGALAGGGRECRGRAVPPVRRAAYRESSQAAGRPRRHSPVRLPEITLNKIRLQAARHRAARRDVGREGSDIDDLEDPAVIGRDPTPSEAAALAEELEQLCAGVEFDMWGAFGFSHNWGQIALRGAT